MTWNIRFADWVSGGVLLIVLGCSYSYLCGSLELEGVMAKKQQPTAADDGWLQAICQTPEDDAPRLVYSDWLDEHNQPERAEFIRLQCRLAKIDAYDPERAHLQWREGQLLTEPRKQAWGRAAGQAGGRVPEQEGGRG